MCGSPDTDLSAKKIQPKVVGDGGGLEGADSSAAETADRVPPEQAEAVANEPAGPGPKDPAMDAEAEAVLAERLRSLGYMP